MQIAVFPWAIVIAGLCVAVSRLADFQPGYLHGGIVAATFVGTSAGLGILVLDSFLVVTFVGALEGVLINLLPMRFLDGLKLMKWNRWVWTGLLLVGLLPFLHVLLSPGSGYIATSDIVPFFTMAALFVGFGLFSIAFWAYFRFRKPREEKEAAK